MPVGPDVSVWLRGPSLLIDYKTFCDIFVDRFFLLDRPGAVVVDAGAHCGYFGAYALVTGAQAVCSLEPQSTNYATLRRTAEAFRRAGHQWQVERCALGDSERTADLKVSSESWSHSLRSPASGTTVAVEHVRVRPLHPILRRLRAEHPGRPLVVKLNIEGAAGEVILSTPVEDWAQVDQVLFDYEPDTPEPLSDVLDHLGAAGHRVLWDNGRDYRLARRQAV